MDALKIIDTLRDRAESLFYAGLTTGMVSGAAAIGVFMSQHDSLIAVSELAHDSPGFIGNSSTSYFDLVVKSIQTLTQGNVFQTLMEKVPGIGDAVSAAFQVATQNNLAMDATKIAMDATQSVGNLTPAILEHANMGVAAIVVGSAFAVCSMAVGLAAKAFENYRADSLEQKMTETASSGEPVMMGMTA